MSCHDKSQNRCQKPENLKDTPEDCTPEQIHHCHSDTGKHECAETAGCEHPERLKGKPGECSPEQICQCHGDAGEH
ncbi:MAG: hypothetical protein ACOC9S_00425, partial [Planctomycetota bacterium]